MIRSRRMLVVALTGGIGSGKSQVSGLLAERGAVVIDADLIAREVVEPGTPGLGAVVERFGPGVLRSDGALDRAALAQLVFGNPSALADLNAIVHPAVRAVIAERLAEEEASGSEVIVLVIPLLFESGGASRYPVSAVIVVDTPEEVAVDRLVRLRGMSQEDVCRRMGAQTSRAERLAAADFVIANDGSIEDLERGVDEVWEWITSLTSPTRTGFTNRGQNPAL